MSALNVTLVQADLVWHDAVGNREQFTAVIEDLPEPTDLIVLPEMFTTGFSMDAPDLAESMDGDSVTWMRDMAVRCDAAVCGSIIIADKSFIRGYYCCPIRQH